MDHRSSEGSRDKRSRSAGVRRIGKLVNKIFDLALGLDWANGARADNILAGPALKDLFFFVAVSRPKDLRKKQSAVRNLRWNR